MLTSQPFTPYGPEQFNQGYDAWPYYVAPRNTYEQQLMGNAGNLYQYAAPYIDQAGQMTNDVYNQAGDFGWGTLNNASNVIAGALPYVGQGGQYVGQGNEYLQQGAREVPRLSGSDIARYLDPYQQFVINATMANIDENQQRQQEDVLGNAVSRGALGGDRLAVAQAELARQQGLSANQTLAGLWNQNYQQALQTAQGQQAVQQQNLARQLQAGQGMGQLGGTMGQLAGTQGQLGQGMGQLAGIGSQLANTQGNLASQMGNLGLANQQAFSQELNALSAAGQLERSFEQQRLNAIYEQYLREMGYPFQALQYRAGVQLPAAGGMGGQQLGIGNQLSNMYGITQSMTPGGQGGGGGGGFNPMSLIGMMGGKGLHSGGRVYADGGAVNPFAEAFAGGGMVIPGVGMTKAKSYIPDIPTPDQVKVRWPEPVKFMPKTQKPGGGGGKGGGKGGGSKSQMPKMPKMPTGKSAQQEGKQLAQAAVKKQNEEPGTQDFKETPNAQPEAIPPTQELPPAAGTEQAGDSFGGSEGVDQVQGGAGEDQVSPFDTYAMGSDDYFGGDVGSNLDDGGFGGDLGGDLGGDFFSPDEASFFSGNDLFSGGEFGGSPGGGFDDFGGGGGKGFGGGGGGKGFGGRVGYDDGGEIDFDDDLSFDGGDSDEVSSVGIGSLTLPEEDETQLPEIVVRPDEAQEEPVDAIEPDEPGDEVEQDRLAQDTPDVRVSEALPIPPMPAQASPFAPVNADAALSVSTQTSPFGQAGRSNLMDFIKKQEGYNPNAYWDHKQWSVGYGTRGSPGERVTRDEAERRFATEVGKARQSVEQFAPDAPPGVKDALTSLTYNAGTKWQGSGLGQLVKQGDWDAARDRFLQYNRASGDVNRGLVNRRGMEIAQLWNGRAANPVAAFTPISGEGVANDLLPARTGIGRLTLPGGGPEAITTPGAGAGINRLTLPGGAPQTASLSPPPMGPPAQEGPLAAPPTGQRRQPPGQFPPTGMMRSFGPEGSEMMPMYGNNMGPSGSPFATGASSPFAQRQPERRPEGGMPGPLAGLGQMFRPGSPFFQGMANSRSPYPGITIMEGLRTQMMNPQQIGEGMAQNALSPADIYRRTGKMPQYVEDPRDGKIYKFDPPKATYENGQLVERTGRQREQTVTQEILKDIQREAEAKGEKISLSEAYKRFRQMQRAGPETAQSREDLRWKRQQALSEFRATQSDRTALPEDKQSQEQIYRKYGLDAQGNPLAASPQSAMPPQEPAPESKPEPKPEPKPQAAKPEPSPGDVKDLEAKYKAAKAAGYKRADIINFFKTKIAPEKGWDPDWAERNYPKE